MFCDKCGGYIKKGHGVRVYTYRGVYIYCCPFCNRVRNWNLNNGYRRQIWFNCGIILSVAIGFLVYFYYPVKQIKVSENTSYSPNKPYWVIFIPPIVWFILYFLLVIPYLKSLEKRDYQPLAKEKTELLEMYNYLSFYNKEKEFCQCRRCLTEEYNKRKVGKSEDSKEKVKKLFDWE